MTPRWRLPLLVLGFVALLFGIAGGLVRLGGAVPAPAGAVALHGALMVSGFLGTVIGLERAVALGQRWAYGAPLASGVGGVCLLVGLYDSGFALLAFAAALLVAASAAVFLRQRSLEMATLAAGAVAWLAGNLLLRGLRGELESINPATTKAYNKSQTVQGIKDCVNNFHRFGIKVHGMFVFGSEEDHYQVIRDTVKVSRQLDLDSVQYLMLTPLPGTPFFKEMEAQNRIICRDWTQYDGHHTVFQPRQFTPFELQMETTRAMRKFYSWTSVVKRLIARDLFVRQNEGLRPHPPVEVQSEKKTANIPERCHCEHLKGAWQFL